MYEALANEGNGADRAFLRKIRAYIDENYTPEEREKIERTWVEGVQHVLANTPDPELSVFDKAKEDINELEAGLGIRNTKGVPYTVDKFFSDSNRIYSQLEDDTIDKEHGFSDLQVFAKDTQANIEWQEYLKLPSEPSSMRSNYRKTHPRLEALLLFWGKVERPLADLTARERVEVGTLIWDWVQEYHINQYNHPHYKTWGLPALPNQR